MEAQSCEITVVMVPLPMQGHLNQLLHLSHLIISYGIPVHFTGFATHNRQAKLRIHGWDTKSLANIHFHDYPLPPLAPYNTTPQNSGHCVPFPMQFYPLFEAATQLREPVAQLLQELSTSFRRVVVIHDIVISSVVQDVKTIPNAETYSLMPISAFTLFLNSFERKAERPLQLEPADLPNCIPSNEGCTPLEIANFVANQLKFVGFESGKIYNTSRLIEDKYIGFLEKLSTTAKIKHFVLGPFHPVRIESKSQIQRHQSLKWLDQQERDSVIYVCFGSSTSLSYEQIRELATGLERSEQKFIWVLKDSDKADIFAEDEIRKPQLPQGFEERVRGRGMVVRDWAPQLEILGHPSTGGFLSHCGWNSCNESISMGVPIAAWPMHSDQPRNTLLVTDVLKIGTLVRDWEHRNQLVTANTIENAVKTLMDTEEGKEMRKRAEELGNAVRNSVVKGGVASSEIDSFIAHITR